VNTGIVIASPAFHRSEVGWESNRTPPDTVESGVRIARELPSRPPRRSVDRLPHPDWRRPTPQGQPAGCRRRSHPPDRRAHPRPINVFTRLVHLQAPASGLLFVVHGGQRKFRLQSLEPRRRASLKTVAGCIAGSFGKAAKVGSYLQPGGCGDKLEVGHPYCTSHIEDLNRNFRGCPRDGRVGDVDPAGTFPRTRSGTPTLKASW
jgi:hypothetical protein